MSTAFVMRRSAEPCELRQMPIVADGRITASGEVLLIWRGPSHNEIRYDSPERLLKVQGAKKCTVITSRNGTQELILDPWHADAFEGTPGEGIVPATGPRRAVWASLDAWGNVTGVAGPAVPGPSSAK